MFSKVNTKNVSFSSLKDRSPLCRSLLRKLEELGYTSLEYYKDKPLLYVYTLDQPFTYSEFLPDSVNRYTIKKLQDLLVREKVKSFKEDLNV